MRPDTVLTGLRIFHAPLPCPGHPENTQVGALLALAAILPASMSLIISASAALTWLSVRGSIWLGLLFLGCLTG